MTPSVTVDREGTVTGNTYDKYGSTNPVVRRLMAGFERTLDELFVKASANSTMLQRVFERVRRLELQADVPPSHYEPGARPTHQPPTTGARAGQRTEEHEAVSA